MLGSADGASSAAKLVPHDGDLLHERHVRRSKPLVLSEQSVRLINLRADTLFQRRNHVRSRGQMPAAVTREVVARRRRMLSEAFGVARWQAGWVSEVIEVVRGEARRLAEFVEVVRREMGVMERRRVRVVTAAGAAGEGGG